MKEKPRTDRVEDFFTICDEIEDLVSNNISEELSVEEGKTVMELLLERLDSLKLIFEELRCCRGTPCNNPIVPG